MGRINPFTDELELDLGRYELRRAGRRIKLEKKPMELLIFLVARREQMVTRTEIISRLWGPDLFIDTETNLNNIVRKIRAALRDKAEKPRFLETVVGKGYRFVGPVRVIAARPPAEIHINPVDQARQSPRSSKDPVAYAEFMRGFKLTASGESSVMEEASQHLTNAVTRDPDFALATPRSRLRARPGISNLILQTIGSKERNFTAAGRSIWRRIWLKVILPARFWPGGRQRIFSIWMPSLI
jgi:DNA-binding winged helix-turn-helix (wHTH) protein